MNEKRYNKKLGTTATLSLYLAKDAKMAKVAKTAEDIEKCPTLYILSS